MILSACSSPEEMVASITVSDPGKHFPILRKTIQLIQSLKKKETNREQKVIFQKKEQDRHNTNKQNFKRKKERKIFLHKKLKDLFPPNIWTMWIPGS